MDDVRNAFDACHKDRYGFSVEGPLSGIYLERFTFFASSYASLQAEREAMKLREVELAALVNELREFIHQTGGDVFYDQMLARTPQQSLEAHDSRVIVKARNQKAREIIDILAEEDVDNDPDDLYSGREHRIRAIEATIEPE